jgi:chromate transporter
LMIVAVAVVAQAVWGMARNLCTDRAGVGIMAVSACFVLLYPNACGQVGAIAVAAGAGLLLFEPVPEADHDPLPIAVSRRAGAMLLGVFFALLAGLPVLAASWPNQGLAMVNAFYRSGSLVFGGGHVILPLLQAAVVPNGWLPEASFLAGYGAAQAVPGPLFTFAAFLGAAMNTAPNGLSGALICLLAIFAPSFLLVIGALPFWEQLRRSSRTRAALGGVNAAVVGLLLAALYDPVWTGAVHAARDAGWVLIAFVALMFWKLPPWLVVIASGAVGGLLGNMS